MTLTSRPHFGHLRPARAADLAAIEAWLPQHGDHETLAGSWRQARHAFERGRLLVWEDDQVRQPVAYAWGALNGPDGALEVAPRWRRRGIGRAIVERLIELSTMSSEPLLEVGCPTDVSKRFWQALGFKIEERDERGSRVWRARLALTLLQALPDGRRVPVRIAFQVRGATAGTRSAALSTWSGTGATSIDGRVVLPLKVACFEPDNGAGLTIEIVANGCLVYVGDVANARTYGVLRCANGYLIGSVTPFPIALLP